MQISLNRYSAHAILRDAERITKSIMACRGGGGDLFIKFIIEIYLEFTLVFKISCYDKKYKDSMYVFFYIRAYVKFSLLYNT